MGDRIEDRPTGFAGGDFIAPPETDERDERAAAPPEREEFRRPPVEKEPPGWDPGHSTAARSGKAPPPSTGDDPHEVA